MKKRLLRTLLAALALALAVASCARGDKVIPKKTMEKIYYDMFMADQWLAVHPEARAKADTSWFYEPVFQKYGYTKEDYLRSVDFYLNDPERYAAMLREVTTRLEKDFNRLTAEAEKEREDQHAAAMAACPFVGSEIILGGDHKPAEAINVMAFLELSHYTSPY